MSAVLPVVLAMALQSIANGLLSSSLDGTDGMLLSVTAFSLCALVLGAASRSPAHREGPPLRGERLRCLVMLNAATAVTFLGFYWSLTLIPAPAAAAVETGSAPLALACARLRSSRGARRAPEPVLGVLAFLCGLALAYRMTATGPHGRPAELVGGTSLVVVAGCSAAWIATLCHRLGQLGVSSVRVTAHRFHLTYSAATAVLLTEARPAGGWFGGRAAFLVCVAALGVALPLFLLQVGMQRTAPTLVTLLGSAVPGSTYLAATAAGGQSFDPLSFLLSAAGLVVACCGLAAAGRRPGAKASWRPRGTRTTPPSSRGAPRRRSAAAAPGGYRRTGPATGRAAEAGAPAAPAGLGDGHGLDVARRRGQGLSR